MISLENEHYIRLILLLIKGGTQVLRETVTSGLKKKDISLNEFLDENRKEICCSKEISKIQQDILYPPSPHFSDISKWDISLLSYICLNFMGSVLTDMEKKEAEKINAMRKAVQAYSETAEIETRKYTHILSELSMTITLLSLTMSEQNRAKVHSLVVGISSDQLDVHAAVEELKLLERRDDFFECIHSSIEILHRFQDFEPSENVAEHFEELRSMNNEVKETGMDTEDDRKEPFSSDDRNTTQESETTVEKEKCLSNNLPNGQKNTQDHNSALCSSVSQFFENVQGPETKHLNDKKVRNTETKTNQDISSEMVFGQGKKQKEFEKTAEEYTARMSNSSLFQQGKETQMPNINESNQQLNEPINNENAQVTSVNRGANKARKSDANMKKMNSGTEASQTFDKNNEGYDVDSGWQLMNEKHVDKSQFVSDQSKILENKPFSNQNEICSDRHQLLSGSDITVHFHILLHPDFKFDASRDIVVVKIGSHLAGGWQSNEHKMSYIQKLSSGHIEFVYSLQTSKQLIIGSDKYVKYKYLVIRDAESRHRKDTKIWEHYFVNGHVGVNYDRILHVPEKWKSKEIFPEIWHQFDAVVNRKPKGVVSSWINDYILRNRQLREDAEIAVSLHSESILKNMNSGAIDMLEIMMHGLRRIYHQHSNCFGTETEMNTVLGAHMLKPMLCLFNEVNVTNADETEEQWQWRMNVQFTLLAILKVFDLFSMDKNNGCIYSSLCKAFLIHPVTDKKTCKELDFLRQNYPNNLRFFKEAFVMLGKAVVRQKKDPAWLYMMPMVHFLSGSCKPFDPVTDDATHAKKVPVWWGTSHIGEDATKEFKTYQNTQWETPLQEVLETLKTLFQVDFLLPRTIVASLNLRELLETLETELIPVEVCCAALVYFVKTTNRQTYLDEKKLLHKCIETLIHQLQTECKADVNCSYEHKLLKRELLRQLSVVCSCLPCEHMKGHILPAITIEQRRNVCNF